MFFTENDIQTKNWRKELIPLFYKNIKLIENTDYPDLNNLEFQYVPGEGAVYKLYKCDQGYYFVGPFLTGGKETSFRKFKTNKWGF